MRASHPSDACSDLRSTVRSTCGRLAPSDQPASAPSAGASLTSPAASLAPSAPASLASSPKLESSPTPVSSNGPLSGKHEKSLWHCHTPPPPPVFCTHWQPPVAHIGKHTEPEIGAHGSPGLVNELHK